MIIVVHNSWILASFAFQELTLVMQQGPCHMTLGRLNEIKSFDFRRFPIQNDRKEMTQKTLFIRVVPYLYFCLSTFSRRIKSKIFQLQQLQRFSRRKGPLRGGIIFQNNCHFEVDQSA